jgi:hypothetical protein
MDKIKCCKPKCKPDLNKCNTVPFYKDPMFTGHLLFLNLIVIIARFKELNFEKHKGASLLWFIIWLEIQILFFYAGLLFFYWVLSSLQILGIFINTLVNEVRNPIKSKSFFITIMKTLKILIVYEIIYKTFCVLLIILLIIICLGLIISFILYVVIFGPILLGYTVFYKNTFTD